MRCSKQFPDDRMTLPLLVRYADLVFWLVGLMNREVGVGGFEGSYTHKVCAASEHILSTLRGEVQLTIQTSSGEKPMNGDRINDLGLEPFFGKLCLRTRSG
jgi:hypothetical protein